VDSAQNLDVITLVVAGVALVTSVVTVVHRRSADG
jgi:hypothetical protein